MCSSVSLQSNLAVPPSTTSSLLSLRDQKLALVPGSAFGAPGTVRLRYAMLHKLETFLLLKAQNNKKVQY